MSKLYKGINFLIIAKNSEDRTRLQTELGTRLRENSCRNVEYYINDNSESITTLIDSRRLYREQQFSNIPLHFIISETTDFPFYKYAAFQLLIPIVTAEWVDKCILHQRFVKASLHSPDERHALKDCNIYISSQSFNYSERLLLHELCTALGATCTETISNRTTHLIASNKLDSCLLSVKQFNEDHDNRYHTIQFVYPTWTIECFKKQRLINENDHLIAPADDEEKLRELWDMVLNDIDFEMNSQQKFMKNRCFYLSHDLQLDGRMFRFLTSFIEKHGGELVSSVFERCDSFIGVSCLTEEYEIAVSKNLNTGNLIWLLRMWSFNEFLCPKSQGLLCIPFKRKLFSKNELKITYTNYYGMQRSYIHLLTSILGGTSTPELSKQNTHLISRFDYGKKFETVKRWKSTNENSSCFLVNHKWLEMCYKDGMRYDCNKKEFQEFENDSQDSISSMLGQVCFETDQDEVEVYCNGDKDSIVTSSTVIASSREPSFLEEDITKHTNPADVYLPEVINNSVHDKDKSKMPTQNPAEFDQDQAEIKTSSEDITKTEKTSVDTANSINCDKNKSPEHHRTPVDLKIDDARSEPQDRSVPQDTRHEDPEYPKEANELAESTFDKTKISPGILKDSNSCDQDGDSESNKITQENILESNESISTELPLPVTPATSQNIMTKEEVELSLSYNKRRAAAEAAIKLHTNIESLNEFQKSNYKRRKVGKMLLPEEKLLIEQRRKLAAEARGMLSGIFKEGERHKIYEIHAVCTGFDVSEMLSKLDMEVLNQLGVYIASDSSDASQQKINCLMAPKRLRTEKFLSALSNDHLKYIIKNTFLTELITHVKQGDPLRSEEHTLLLEPRKFSIPDLDVEKILNRKQFEGKLFSNANITHVNLLQEDVKSVDVVTRILRNHGMQQINVLTKKDLKLDRLICNCGPSATTHDRESEGYVFIANKGTGLSRIKKLATKEQLDKVLVVDWDWCVESIFHLETNIESALWHHNF